MYFYKKVLFLKLLYIKLKYICNVQKYSYIVSHFNQTFYTYPNPQISIKFPCLSTNIPPSMDSLIKTRLKVKVQVLYQLPISLNNLISVASKNITFSLLNVINQYISGVC